jgi:dynein heavy chain
MNFRRLSQMMEYSGWYSRHDLNWQNVVDFVVLASMAPPGGGRNRCSPRILRHMHVVGMSEHDDSSLLRIFAVILQVHFKRGGYAAEVSGLARQVRWH